MRFNEQGRSMIEMLGVLAIVGVLSVGGIAGYSKAMNKFKTNKLIEQINMISTNVRTLYASQKDYSGLYNGTAIKTGVLPNEMVGTSAASATAGSAGKSDLIINAFAGSVYIAPGAVTDDEEAGAFLIGVDKIPEASCVSIVTTEWGGDAGGGLLNIAVKTGADSAAPTAAEVAGLLEDVVDESTDNADDDATFSVKDGGLPVSVVQASTVCGGAANAIAWKYM